MSSADNHATVRLLAVLVMTPEDELLEFKRRCLDKDSGVSAAQLGAARELLLSLSTALKEGDEDDWRRIEHARDALGRPMERAPAPAGASRPVEGAPAPAGSAPFLNPPSAQDGERSPWTGSAPVVSPAPPMAPPAAPAPPPPPQPIQVPLVASPRRQPHAGATVDLEHMSPLAGLVIPFSGSNNAPPAPAASEADPDPGASAGETVSGEISPVANLAIPFESEASEEGPRSTAPAPNLTLEQYASLCASCQENPAATARIEKEYGVYSQDQRRSLHAHWHARLAADPEQKGRLEQLISHYRDWIRKKGT